MLLKKIAPGLARTRFHRRGLVLTPPQCKAQSSIAGAVDKSFLVVYFGGFLLAAALWSVPGCSTPDRLAYNSAQVATVTVETAMKRWDAYLAEHHPSAAIETRVKDAYDAYRESDKTLLRAGASLLKLDPHKGDVAALVAAEGAWEAAELGLARATFDLFAALKSSGLSLP
jgi:hypothetical protein